MEIGVEDGMSTVPVPVIFKELIKNLPDAMGHPLDISDIHGNPYQADMRRGSGESGGPS